MVWPRRTPLPLAETWRVALEVGVVVAERRGGIELIDGDAAPLTVEQLRDGAVLLAAKAFASWTAYQGRGLLTIVRGLEAALALVRVEAARQCRDASRPLDADLLRDAFRQADFTLNHLAVGDDLASAWSRVEESGSGEARSGVTPHIPPPPPRTARSARR